MNFKLSTLHTKEFGFKIQCEIYDLYPPRSYNRIYFESEWAEFFDMDKTQFFEKMKEHGAVNYCTKEFPSVYFPTEKIVNKAIENFYEPMLMIKKIIA